MNNIIYITVLLFITTYISAQKHNSFREESILTNKYNYLSEETSVFIKEMDYFKSLRNKSEYKMALDSITNSDSTLIIDRMHYFYDSYGRDTCEIRYSRGKPWWPWYPSEKTAFKFNNENQILSYATYTYKALHQNWQIDRLITYNYDANNNITVEKLFL